MGFAGSDVSGGGERGGVHRIGLVVFGLVLWVGGGVPGAAQVPGATPLAQFREATALAVAPGGRFYVADAGHDVVRRFGADGAPRATLGGSGTRAGEFDGPRALDPTNGQTLYVADAGNGRVQQFSAEFQYVGALAVGTATDLGVRQRTFDDGRDGADVQGTGRPIAVASSDGNDTFVVDAREDHIVRFDAQGRADRLIGPAGRLDDPVALAVEKNRRLYVADRGREGVMVYDLFGTFIERLSLPPLPEVQSLSINEGQLWIVSPRRVFVWTPETDTVRRHAVSLDAALVGAAPWEGEILLLTEHRLYRRPEW
jgi:DNA-binding beta-propeller fold protein YncE